MKTVSFLTRLLLVAALSAAVTGCKKTPKSPTPIFNPARTAPRGDSNPSGIEGGATLPSTADPSANPLAGNPDGSGGALAPRPASLDDYNQDREMFRQETVYFGFDKYNVAPNELPKIQNVANYLIGQTAAAVLLEGHCDERGTPEYNRALGERRAISIRETLMTLGISGDRIHTTSYGEDRPADSGTSEEAYTRNRRGEFILLQPKTGTAGL
jgi:peptidoglycan-associated lipoprotein